MNIVVLILPNNYLIVNVFRRVLYYNLPQNNRFYNDSCRNMKQSYEFVVTNMS